MHEFFSFTTEVLSESFFSDILRFSARMPPRIFVANRISADTASEEIKRLTEQLLTLPESERKARSSLVKDRALASKAAGIVEDVYTEEYTEWHSLQRSHIDGWRDLLCEGKWSEVIESLREWFTEIYALPSFFEWGGLPQNIQEVFDFNEHEFKRIGLTEDDYKQIVNAARTSDFLAFHYENFDATVEVTSRQRKQPKQPKQSKC